LLRSKTKKTRGQQYEDFVGSRNSADKGESFLKEISKHPRFYISMFMICSYQMIIHGERSAQFTP